MPDERHGALPDAVRLPIAEIGEAPRGQETSGSLRGVFESTLDLVGESFLRTALIRLAKALELDAVYVGVHDRRRSQEPNGATIRTLAWVEDGDLRENVVSALAASPARDLEAEEILLYKQGVCTRFASDELLVSMQCQSWVGIPFFEPQPHSAPPIQTSPNRETGQRVVGHLALLDKKSIDPALLDLESLELLRRRLGAEIMRLERERQVLARRILDEATGLPNRNLFWDRLSTALDRAARGSHLVALIDIEVPEFDVLRSRFGDRAASEIGRRLRDAVRATDAVCRIGDNEFTVLLESIQDWRDVEAVSLSVYHALTHSPLELGTDAERLVARMGVAVYPEDGVDGELLLDRAGRARASRDEGGLGFYSVGP